MMTSVTLGIGRKTLLMDAYVVEQKSVPNHWRQIVGRTLNTTQYQETIRQYRGFGPAEVTPEGENVRLDDIAPLFSADFKPYQVTKGIRYTLLTEETAQFDDILAKQKQFANSFMTTRNIVVANMLNNGFTTTGNGVPTTETLFSSTHQVAPGGTVQSNLITGALSPYTIEQAIGLLMAQKNPAGLPMPVSGKVNLFVHPTMLGPATRYVESSGFATTGDNDTNDFIKLRVNVIANPYLTSTTAWFMVAADPEQNFLFMLEQMAYRYLELPMSLDLFKTYIAVESYIPGWFDWRGTVASTGL